MGKGRCQLCSGKEDIKHIVQLSRKKKMKNAMSKEKMVGDEQGGGLNDSTKLYKYSIC